MNIISDKYLRYKYHRKMTVSDILILVNSGIIKLLFRNHISRYLPFS